MSTKAPFLATTLCFVFLTAFDTSAQEVVEFEGPDDAPIYVIEGDFRQTGSFQQFGGNWFFATDIAATMNVNSGAMTSVGTMSMSGSGFTQGIQFSLAMNISLAMKSVLKQAGDSVRWSGKAAMTGPMSVSVVGYGAESFTVAGIWTYRNMTLDPATGEQTGLMSYNATGRTAYGQRFPMRQAPIQTIFPRPTIYSSEGEWRNAAGDWSAELTADVYPNGKIAGTGELTVGDSEDPYANVAQKVTGRVNAKTGVVTLSGTGSEKTTSRVKVTLNYVNATGDTVAGKSSVSAYAQKRKF